MDLWLSVIDKKMAHPNEIQNTKVRNFYEQSNDKFLKTWT